jgi:hypothetical protein
MMLLYQSFWCQNNAHRQLLSCALASSNGAMIWNKGTKPHNGTAHCYPIIQRGHLKTAPLRFALARHP